MDLKKGDEGADLMFQFCLLYKALDSISMIIAGTKIRLGNYC